MRGSRLGEEPRTAPALLGRPAEHVDCAVGLLANMQQLPALSKKIIDSADFDISRHGNLFDLSDGAELRQLCRVRNNVHNLGVVL